MIANKHWLGFTLLMLLISTVLFWSAYHNLDLLYNYSLIFNDINENQCSCDNGFYNIREINDCTSTNFCPDSKKIYLLSMLMRFGAYFLLVGLIMGFVIDKWKKEKKEIKNDAKEKN